MLRARKGCALWGRTSAPVGLVAAVAMLPAALFAQDAGGSPHANFEDLTHRQLSCILTVGFRTADVPFTTQTRLIFDVVLPLWGPRGPRPTPAIPVHNEPLSVRERQRS